MLRRRARRPGARLVRTYYTCAFLEDFVLLYPVYVLLFADTGLSAGAISSLFVLWSVAGFALEVPSGLWADLFSRRRLLVLAPLLTGAGYALWTLFPSYPAFAAGFLLWGAGGALRSGTEQALVYEELARTGSASAYARVIGRAEALRTTAILAATALAAPALRMGGYTATGLASVAVCVLGALAACAYPESRAGRPGDGEQGTLSALLDVFRAGLREVRGSRAVRNAVLLVAVVSGVLAMDEYLPLLLRTFTADDAAVPLMLLVVSAGVAAGGWCAGHGERWLGPALMAAAVLLAAGAAAGGTVAGPLLLAGAFGLFQWSMTTSEARLQHRLTDTARATVTSFAGFTSEVIAVLLFTAYALTAAYGATPAAFFAAAATLYALTGAFLVRGATR